MKLSIEDVKRIFKAVFSGAMTREDAERWAEQCMHAFDNEELIFEPIKDQELLWSAVNYFSGTAIKVSPNEYLEDDNGIKEEFYSKWDI